MTSRLVELSDSECLALLGSGGVGRLGIVDRGYPLVLPLHFEVIEADQGPRLRVHTRVGNVIDHPGTIVCFEIDGMDARGDTGWSVLVRGILVAPHPATSDHGSVVDEHWQPLDIVPTQKRPTRSTAPSLGRFSGRSASSGASCMIRPVSGLTR